MLGNLNAEGAYHQACAAGYVRLPELESIILTDVRYAYWYARDIIKGRWLEAEEIIAQSDYSNTYANFWFGNELVVTKSEMSDFAWHRAGAIGYYGKSSLFECPDSALDELIERGW